MVLLFSYIQQVPCTRYPKHDFFRVYVKYVPGLEPEPEPSALEPEPSVSPALEPEPKPSALDWVLETSLLLL